MDGGSNLIAPRLAIAEKFRELYAGAADAPVRLEFLDPKPRRLQNGEPNPDYQFPVERWGTLRELWHEVTQRQNEGYSIYYFVNVVPPGRGVGKYGAATDDDVTTCRAFATDHDDGLPRDEKWHLTPSLIVHTSLAVKDHVQ